MDITENTFAIPQRIEEDFKWQTQKKEEPTKPTPEEKLAAAEAEVDALVKKGLKALDEFEKLDQKQVDHIVAKASVAALNKHLVLAKMAVEETHRGLVEDKATKNIFACEHVTNYLAGQKTVGIIREDDVLGIDEIAEPVGVVAGVTPVTNPTSTAIFKSLIALKTRCPIIFGFHPRRAEVLRRGRQDRARRRHRGRRSRELYPVDRAPVHRGHRRADEASGVATILATGGPGMVKAAYSSGKPALGVGAGNAPAYVDKNVDIVRAANDLVLSKHFDYGMICATEQAIIADKDIYGSARQGTQASQGLFRERRREGQARAVHVRLHRRLRPDPDAQLRGAGQVPAVHRQGRRLRDSGRRHHPCR